MLRVPPRDPLETWPKHRAEAIRLGVLIDCTSRVRSRGLERRLPWPVAITDTLQHTLMGGIQLRSEGIDPLDAILEATGDILDQLRVQRDLADPEAPFEEAYAATLVLETMAGQEQRLTVLLQPGDRAEPVVTIGHSSDFGPLED